MQAVRAGQRIVARIGAAREIEFEEAARLAQAVGVRVSTLSFDCCGDIVVTLLLRSRAIHPDEPTVRPVSGMVFSCPVVPALVLVDCVFGLPPVIQKVVFMRISPPTRIEVSVPGIRNERGKLPPVICTLTGPGGPPTPNILPGTIACAS